MRTLFLLLIIAVAPSSASALEVPQFNKGGFLIALEAGAAVPGLDRATLDGLFLGAPLVFNTVQSAAGVGFRLGYNILGHATIGADLTATGWEVTNDRRGGAGFVVG